MSGWTGVPADALRAGRGAVQPGSGVAAMQAGCRESKYLLRCEAVKRYQCARKSVRSWRSTRFHSQGPACRSGQSQVTAGDAQCVLRGALFYKESSTEATAQRAAVHARSEATYSPARTAASGHLSPGGAGCTQNGRSKGLAVHMQRPIRRASGACEAPVADSHVQNELIGSGYRRLGVLGGAA